MKTNSEILDEYLRPKLLELLAQCNKGQQGKFKRLFGEVATMLPEKIPRAIALCERTVKNNKEQDVKKEVVDMNQDRAESPDSPGRRKIFKEHQISVTGNMAKHDSLVKAAQVIRDDMQAPMALIFVIYANEMKVGSATNTSIPEKITADLVKRLIETIQQFLAEPAEPEGENDVQPP